MSLPDFTHPFNVYEAQAVVRALKSGGTSGVYLLDLREEFEVQALAPLPHALVIHLRDLDASMQMWDKDFRRKYGVRKPRKKDRILVYASNERRAASGSAFLTWHGYKSVVYMNAKMSEYLELTQGELDEDL
ncbi:hypothetical protein JKF63_06902 [Porcisia hertigi]|uniref:Rhodanese domain-containing protein n=1 Tax=Porcisia hertigi TaxID=2761500 RepID=A0A836LJC4_9TRYP|nr:hypothetical protein JKF63_06902 [Porcisia hertigi]